MISNEELVKYCTQELSDATHGDLATEREKALDYYHGDISDYVTAEKDRSQVVTRDVLDTIESVLPSLIKIFVEEENAIEFQAISPQDEELAKLETQAVRSVFFRENNGFMNLYTFIKDCLLSKVGILEVSSCDYKYSREEYKNLDQIELQAIEANPNIEAETVEAYDDGTFDVTIKVKHPREIEVDTVTPEEFGISPDACSPSVKDATFCWKTSKVTASKLIEEGFDRKKIEEIARAGEEDALGAEQLARRRLSEEQETSHPHWSMANLWVTECYPKIDRNEDGIAETLKVTLVGPGQAQYTNMKLLEVEEVRCNPFAAATPIILTHKFYGYSLADLIMDIQEIRTVLFRGILDNMYLANNVRMAANENVNLDDLLTSRPGGIVRTQGYSPPLQHVSPLVHPPIPGESFGLLEVLDEMVKNRTGVGDEVAGLDSSSLANINTGVIMQAYDQARMRIELMARIIAEVGLKDCFQDIREELHAIQDQSIQLKIGPNWVDVNPRFWADKRKVKINIGLGNQNKMQRKLSLEKTLMLQEKAQATGYMTPDHLYNTISDMMELEGMDVNRHFPNPQTYQPPPPQVPLQLQIEMKRVQIEEQRAINDSEKSKLDAQVKIQQAALRERETQMKAEMDAIKSRMSYQKQMVDEQSQIMRAQNESASMMLNGEMKVREQSFREQQAALDAHFEQQKLMLEEFAAKLQAATQIETKQMELEQKIQSDVMDYIKSVNQTMIDLEKQRREEKEKILQHIMLNGTDRTKKLAQEMKGGVAES